MTRNQSENAPTIKCPHCGTSEVVGVVAPAYIWFEAEVHGTAIHYNPRNREVEETGDDALLECGECGTHFEKPAGFRIAIQ